LTGCTPVHDLPTEKEEKDPPKPGDPEFLGPVLPEGWKPEEEEEKEEEVIELLQINQLRDILKETGHFQANFYTKSMLAELNLMLVEYGIITHQQVKFFLAASIHESRLSVTEAGWLPENSVREYCKRYEPKTDIGKRLGNTESGDGYKFRGAGYIQLTGRYNYQKFSDYIEKKYGHDPKIMEEGADYVAKKYAWEIAGYYWDTHSINDIIEKGNIKGQDEISTFKQVSNAINRGNAFSEREPGEWEERLKRFKELMKAW